MQKMKRKLCLTFALLLLASSTTTPARAGSGTAGPMKRVTLTWEDGYPWRAEYVFRIRGNPGKASAPSYSWPVILTTTDLSASLTASMSQFTVTIYNTLTGEEGPFATSVDLGGWQPAYPGQPAPIGQPDNFKVTSHL